MRRFGLLPGWIPEAGGASSRTRALASLPVLLVLIILFPSGGLLPCTPEGEAYLAKGRELYLSYHLAPGRYDQAIQMYEKALALCPRDYDVLWRLAEMYESYGEMLPPGEKKRKIACWKKGLAYGERAVEADPRGKEGHFFYMANMGALARAQGTWALVRRFRRITKELEKTLELDPDYPPALVARGQYLTELPRVFGGDEKEAVRLYRRALEIDPGYIAALYYLARIDAKHGRYDDALEKIQGIFECQNPWHPGHAARIIRPWAEALRRQILEERR